MVCMVKLGLCRMDCCATRQEVYQAASDLGEGLCSPSSGYKCNSSKAASPYTCAEAGSLSELLRMRFWAVHEEFQAKL